ncbi:MAG: hypothetical protein JO290_06765, partial [Sphingomonadaceae bacterium]|nr:hypothetical protein [Sphingomonadaceae bacterium]
MMRTLVATALLVAAGRAGAATLPDTLDLGRGPQGELCRAERVWGDPAAPGLFDVSLNVRCRGWTETASVGHFRVTASTADATMRLDAARDAELVCGAGVPVTIDGVGRGTARRCIAREAGYEAVAVEVTRRGKTYAIDGLKRFTGNLAAGLRLIAGSTAKGSATLVPASAPVPPASVATPAAALDATALGFQRTEVLDYSIRGQHGEAREIGTRYLAKLPTAASKFDRIDLTLDAALSESNLGYRDVADAYLKQAAAMLDAADGPRGAAGERLRDKLQVYRAVDALNARNYAEAAHLAQAALV